MGKTIDVIRYPCENHRCHIKIRYLCGKTMVDVIKNTISMGKTIDVI